MGHRMTVTSSTKLARVDNVEHYLELRFRNGTKTAFAYDKLGWFNYSPDSTGMELDFMGTAVVVIGRGLTELFQPLKSRRISWLKEADTDLQDNDSNSVFISELFIVPPASELQNEEPTR